MVEILECTIRDGSYAVGFKWTSEDVFNIVSELSQAGFKRIEIGHGLGLGASFKTTQQLCSDDAYTKIAVKAKRGSKIGAFFIPSIGTKDDIKSFFDIGGDFIRIGTNVSFSEEAFEYIEYAKTLGLEVGFNFMKSYAVTPYELCKRAVEIEKCGVDYIFLVDSAGGMLPKQVSHYVSVLKDILKVKVGFHGHNNLLMANANSLAAVESGAEIIDATLMGIGRGAGNAQTETLIVLLEESGHPLGIDPLKVSKISEKYISSKTSSLKGSNGKELVLGYALFHDSNLRLIEKYSEEFSIDYQKLIIEVGKVNKENPSEELICNVAKQLSVSDRVNIPFPKFFHKEVK